MYGPGRRGLDRPEDGVVDVHELAQLGEVTADERVVVLVVEAADLLDPVLAVLVADHRARGRSPESVG